MAWNDKGFLLPTAIEQYGDKLYSTHPREIAARQSVRIVASSM